MSGAVTAHEAALLTLARNALGIAASGDLSRALVTSVVPPAKLGPTAQGELQDTLSRGTVLALARAGGWAQGSQGRLWDYAALPRLEFTGNVIRLLQWVLKTPLSEHGHPPLSLDKPLTPAEEVFVVLLLQRIKGLPGEQTLAEQPVLRSAPLVLLAHAGTLARAAVMPEVLPPLRLADHAVYVSALLDLMAKSWARDESVKGELERTDELTRIGQTQTAVTGQLYSLIEGSLTHRALAGFLIDAAGHALRVPRTANELTGSLNATAPLRERMEARKQAASLMRALARLRTWDAEHRAMHFLDDGFDRGQALIKDWSSLGELGFRAAEQLVTALDALPT